MRVGFSCTLHVCRDCYDYSNNIYVFINKMPDLLTSTDTLNCDRTKSPRSVSTEKKKKNRKNAGRRCMQITIRDGYGDAAGGTRSDRRRPVKIFSKK